MMKDFDGFLVWALVVAGLGCCAIGMVVFVDEMQEAARAGTWFGSGVGIYWMGRVLDRLREGR